MAADTTQGPPTAPGESNLPDDDHPEFDNESIWPRRLLHVPSMTSYKWAPGNTYGSHAQPKYAALSYTWGRWRLKEDAKLHVKPLPIKGLPWSLPRVDPSLHFALSDFTNVIQEAIKDPVRYYYLHGWKKTSPFGSTAVGSLINKLIWYIQVSWGPPLYEFLWLDIACIDQRHTIITAAEVGRQARIFQNAGHVYAWLSRSTHTMLESMLLDLQQSSIKIEMEPLIPQSVAQVRDYMSLINRALKRLVEDPWFTSLWTLQEAYLCPKAIILSHDGRPLSERGVNQIMPQSWTLGHIASHANNLIFWTQETKLGREQAEYDDLIDVIRKTGLAALWKNNPMSVLGLAHLRQTSREVDRIYAIMQVFGTNFRVGQSRIPTGDAPTSNFNKLQDEFDALVLEKFPVLSQMHVYLEKPSFGQGWCIRGKSDVPEALERGDLFGWEEGASHRLDIDIDIFCHPLCAFKVCKVEHNQWASLSGKACSLSLLRQAWKRADESEFADAIQRSGWKMHRRAKPSIMLLAMDHGYRFEDLSREQHGNATSNFGTSMREYKTAELVDEHFSAGSVQVLILGRCEFGVEAFNSGLLIIQQNENNVMHWHRIGVCIWLVSHLTKSGREHADKPLLTGESSEWNEVNGLFG